MKLIAGFRSLITLVGIALILQGCATMNEDECLNADWSYIGERDGARGQQESMFDSRARACQEYGVTADLTAYREGYSYGISKFCIPNNGYTSGVNKVEYQYVCPIELQDSFLREYVKGLNYAINQIDFEQRELDIEYREAEIAYKEARTAEQREAAERQINYIEITRNNLRDENIELRSWINFAIDQL